MAIQNIDVLFDFSHGQPALSDATEKRALCAESNVFEAIPAINMHGSKQLLMKRCQSTRT